MVTAPMHRMITLCGLATLLALTASAAEPARKLKGTVKQTAPKIDLGLPSFGPAKVETGLQRLTDPALTDAPTASSETPYQVTSVVQTKSVIRSGKGLKASAPLEVVAARGEPLMSERFISLIHVKAPSKRGTRIDLKVVDSRGDTTMAAEGQLSFRGEELDWTVDWEPAFVRTPGEFHLEIQIGTQPVVSFAFKIEPKKD